MSRSEEFALAELVYHWGEAYAISHPRPGLWCAQRRDDRSTLTADTSGELLSAVSADYSARPVPRSVSLPAAED